MTQQPQDMYEQTNDALYHKLLLRDMEIARLKEQLANANDAVRAEQARVAELEAENDQLKRRDEQFESAHQTEVDWRVKAQMENVELKRQIARLESQVENGADLLQNTESDLQVTLSAELAKAIADAAQRTGLSKSRLAALVLAREFETIAQDNTHLYT